MTQKWKIYCALLFMVFIFGLNTASAESDCTSKILVANGADGHNLGAIFDPPLNSKYSVWEPIVPHALAIDSKENIYIGDSVNYRIIKFDKSGRFLLAFPLQPPIREKKPELSHFIQDIAIDNNDNLYIINLLEYRVEQYSQEGKLIKMIDYHKDSLNDIGKTKHNFQPSKLTIDRNGNIYIYKLSRTCIKKASGGIYSSDGNLVKKGVCVSFEGKGLLNYNEVDMTGFSGYLFKIKPIDSSDNKDGVEILITDADGKAVTTCKMNGEQSVIKMDRFANLYTIDLNTLNVIKISPRIK